MNSLVALFLLMPLAATALTPQQLARDDAHEPLFEVAFDGPRGVAVGDVGRLRVTEDGGTGWTDVPVPTRLALLGVTISGEHAIAVGQMGTILYRDANGRWVQAETDAPVRLFAVAVNADGIALAVGQFGTILRSTDGGRQWAPVEVSWDGMFEDPMQRLSFFEPNLFDVALRDDGTAVIVGEVSLILRSEDAGRSFEAVHAGASTEEGMDPSLFSIDLRNDGVAYVVGQEGVLQRSTDHGRQWHTVATPARANLLAVGSDASGGVVVIGMRSAYHRADGAADWQPVSGYDLQTGWYSGIAWPRNAPGPVLVGNAGSILKLVP
jgi:photosystem II stability/assembly factor-like uncharacterized protein